MNILRNFVAKVQQKFGIRKFFSKIIRFFYIFSLQYQGKSDKKKIDGEAEMEEKRGKRRKTMKFTKNVTFFWKKFVIKIVEGVS